MNNTLRKSACLFPLSFRGYSSARRVLQASLYQGFFAKKPLPRVRCDRAARAKPSFSNLYPMQPGRIRRAARNLFANGALIFHLFYGTLGGRLNDSGDCFGLGNEYYMAPLYLRDRRTGAFCHKPLLVRREFMIFGSHYIPGGFGFPCRLFYGAAEYG